MQPLRVIRPALPLALLAAAASRGVAAQLPTDSARRVAVAGAVWDSVAAAPLVGAALQIVDPADPSRVYSAETDSLGRYRIGAIRPGRYLAGFIHPALDVLAIGTPMVALTLGGDSLSRIDLAIPGPSAVRRAVCRPASAKDSSAMLVGLVRDAESGEPVAGARVVLSWWELELGRGRGGVRTVPRHVTVPANESGRFMACGLPVDADLTAVAESPGRRSGVLEVMPVPRGILRRDFAVGPVLAAVAADSQRGRGGQATLRGVVRRVDGAPVEGAHVVVVDTQGDAHTRDDGTFAIAGLPSGTYTVEARAVGLVPRRVAVDLSSRTPATAELVLDQHVATLDRVVVRGTRSVRDVRLDEIMDRQRRGGFGHFVTAADLDRRPVSRLSDGLRTVPGLQIVPAPNGVTNVVRGRLGCVPDVFLDGLRIQGGADDFDLVTSPRAVMGVEVFLGIAAVPMQFARYDNQCGVVLVWTK